MMEYKDFKEFVRPKVIRFATDRPRGLVRAASHAA